MAETKKDKNKNSVAIQARPSMGYMLTEVLYCKRKVHCIISNNNTKTHLLEFSTFSWLPMPLSYIVLFKHVGHWAGLTHQIKIHEIQNQMKCILFNQRPCDIYFSCPMMLSNLQWLPNHEWRTRLLFRDEKTYSAFTYHQIDQSIKCSQSTTYWVGEPNNCLAALIKY